MGIFLVGRRPTPQDGTHTWHYDGSQEPVARQITEPRRDSASTALLRRHSI